MLRRKLVTGLLLAATISGSVLTAAAQDGLPWDGRGSGAVAVALEAAAAETGLDSAAILALVANGTTLADIVSAEGGDVQVVIDAAVAAMTERIDAAVANGLLTEARSEIMTGRLEAAVADALNGTWTAGRMGGLRDRLNERLGRGGQNVPNSRGGRGNGQFGGANNDGFFGGRGLGIGDGLGLGLGRGDGVGLGLGIGDGLGQLNSLLDDLGIDPQVLRDQLQAGGTVAEAITAAGGDPQAAVAAVLAAAEERHAVAVENGRLTQADADARLVALDVRLQAMLDASPVESRIVMQLLPSALSLLADETGLTNAEIRQQLAAGATVADLLAANDIDVTAFVDTLVERAAARLNVQVVDGRMTQAQADAALANLRERIEQQLNASATDAEVSA